MKIQHGQHGQRVTLLTTTDESYTDRMVDRELAGGLLAKTRQAPYRWNVRRLQLGRVLDVGCGIGRNLVHLKGNGVGVDHNPHSVGVARRRGLTAYTTAEFPKSRDAKVGGFDTLMCSHVLEHLEYADAESLIREYLPYVRPNGRVAVFTPQESGHRSDETHRTFMDFERVSTLLEGLGLKIERRSSFPLPRRFGNSFRFNEFIVLARAPREPAAGPPAA